MNIYISEYFSEIFQKYLSAVLLFFAVFLCFSYIYMVNSLVFDAVTKQRNDREILRLTAEIGLLENAYFKKNSEINIDMARSLGFKDDFSKVHFSSENTRMTGNVSLLDNEI